MICSPSEIEPTSSNAGQDADPAQWVKRGDDAFAAAGALPAGADEIAAVETVEVRFVDAVPQGPSVAARLAEIRRRIQAALVYPPLARMQRIEGEALVRFAIEHDGTARDVVVHRSSGRPSLDRAATLAVTAAAELPSSTTRTRSPIASGRPTARRSRRATSAGATPTPSRRRRGEWPAANSAARSLSAGVAGSDR